MTGYFTFCFADLRAAKIVLLELNLFMAQSRTHSQIVTTPSSYIIKHTDILEIHWNQYQSQKLLGMSEFCATIDATRS